MMYDHKAIILLLINQLFCEGKIKNKEHHEKTYTEIRHKTLILRNMFIKNEIKGNMNYDNAVMALMQLKETEKKPLKHYLMM